VEPTEWTDDQENPGEADREDPLERTPCGHQWDGQEEEEKTAPPELTDYQAEMASPEWTVCPACLD